MNDRVWAPTGTPPYRHRRIVRVCLPPTREQIRAALERYWGRGPLEARLAEGERRATAVDPIAWANQHLGFGVLAPWQQEMFAVLYRVPMTRHDPAPAIRSSLPPIALYAPWPDVDSSPQAPNEEVPEP